MRDERGHGRATAARFGDTDTGSHTRDDGVGRTCGRRDELDVEPPPRARTADRAGPDPPPTRRRRARPSVGCRCPRWRSCRCHSRAARGHRRRSVTRPLATLASTVRDRRSRERPRRAQPASVAMRRSHARSPRRVSSACARQRMPLPLISARDPSALNRSSGGHVASSVGGVPRSSHRRQRRECDGRRGARGRRHRRAHRRRSR